MKAWGGRQIREEGRVKSGADQRGGQGKEWGLSERKAGRVKSGAYQGGGQGEEWGRESFSQRRFRTHLQLKIHRWIYHLQCGAYERVEGVEGVE
jgi:hypothetical protein